MDGNCTAVATTLDVLFYIYVDAGLYIYIFGIINAIFVEMRLKELTNEEKINLLNACANVMRATKGDYKKAYLEGTANEYNTEYMCYIYAVKMVRDICDICV